MSTTAASSIIETGTWTVDPAHSSVGFAVRHAGIATIRGEFTRFEGTLEVSDDLSTAHATGSVEVASVFTNEPQRDEHLRSPDFFDAEQYPNISFTSTQIEPGGDTSFRVVGNLTLHGVTKEIVLDGSVQGTEVDPFGNQRVGLELHGELSRGDYGMGFNMPLASGGLFVSDRVKLTIDISAIRQS
jgi:polyisoprenoid-binding protein YceI